MNKVKVWGKEIDSCWKCYHHGHTDFDELCCSYTGTVIKSDINEDCPFSKPITKEVIEGHGFEIIKEQGKSFQARKCFKSNIKSIEGKYDINGYWDIVISSDLYVIINEESFGKTTYFRGTVNNPVELEFILKSIGVIE